MSQPIKKRVVKKEKLKAESDSSSSSCSSSDEDEYMGNEEIQVDFEGRCPVDSDIHGIKLLLQQLFLKAQVDTSELAELIINQNYVGSVVKQCDDEPESDSEETDSDDVYGVTTVINLSETDRKKCVSQINTMLKELYSKCGDDRSVSKFKEIMNDENCHVGLLINERFINIPSQISVPLLVNLRKEIHNASQKKMPFDFKYFILICKLYKSDVQKKKSKKKKTNAVLEPEIIWTNPEEEIFTELADCSFEFRVKEGSDNAVSGKWGESDSEMAPWRKILLFPAAKLDEAISKVQTMLQ